MVKRFLKKVMMVSPLRYRCSFCVNIKTLVLIYCTWVRDCNCQLTNICVVVNFLFQLIFIFPLFWGMVMYANEFKTKEKQKLTEIKN